MSWVVKVGDQYWGNRFTCSQCGKFLPPTDQKSADRFKHRGIAEIVANCIGGARVVRLVKRRKA